MNHGTEAKSSTWIVRRQARSCTRRLGSNAATSSMSTHESHALLLVAVFAPALSYVPLSLSLALSIPLTYRLPRRVHRVFFMLHSFVVLRADLPFCCLCKVQVCWAREHRVFGLRARDGLAAKSLRSCTHTQSNVCAHAHWSHDNYGHTRMQVPARCMFSCRMSRKTCRAPDLSALQII